MRSFSVHRQVANAEQRKLHASYLAQWMAPAIHALLLLAALLYVLATVARSVVGLGTPPTTLAWRLALVVPLLMVALAARRTRRPRPLGGLALGCLLLLEIGINLNAAGSVAGQSWVTPGLLLPVASSVIWIGRWDFLAAMTLCALGPLPALWLAGADPAHVSQYAVFMGMSITVAAVLRSFMTRTLLEQFRLEQQLRESANTDGLTGLLLRNRFLELARHAIGEGRQEQQSVCMLYLDVDHFKLLNDNFGRAAGDAALVSVATALRSQIREGDLIGRMGGEEFAQLLTGAGMQQASHRAEGLRLAVRGLRGSSGALTVSIGIAECAHGPCTGVEMLLAQADHAMRQAKTRGRDRIVAA